MISRRAFLLTSGALAGASGVGVRLAASLSQRPVVTYFDGQLWLDSSGASVAYRAPTAARAIPPFTDEELARARGYI